MSRCRVALVHDWLTGMRGGEWVLAEIASMFPSAHIFTLVHKPGSVTGGLERHEVHTSWLQKLSFGGRKWRYLLPLMPAAIESMELPKVELVISTSHCVAKGVLPPPGAYHISYVHTPMRYAWDQRGEYVRQLPSMLRPLAQLELARLREWDVVSSARVDRMLANSRFVAWRIRHFWNRTAEVLPPPVDTDFFTPGEKRDDFLLVVAALVPYKRIDLAIEVASRLGMRLVVVGVGPMRRKLARMARGNVEFVGTVSRDELRRLYRSARLLLVPNLEDFGMVAVEALACGTPVVGVADCGTADIIRDGQEGTLAETATADDLKEAVVRALDTAWDEEALRARALCFSKEKFRMRFKYLLDRLGFSPEVAE